MLDNHHNSNRQKSSATLDESTEQQQSLENADSDARIIKQKSFMRRNKSIDPNSRKVVDS